MDDKEKDERVFYSTGEMKKHGERRQVKDDMDVRYFADKEEHAFSTPTNERQPLSEESLAVVFRFIKWQEDRDDLIKSVKKFTDEEIEHHSWFGFQGLAEHLKEFREYLINLKTLTRDASIENKNH